MRKLEIPYNALTKCYDTDLHTVNGGTWKGTKDHSITVYMAWNHSNILLEVNVLDDLHSVHGLSSWNGDALQILFTDSGKNKILFLCHFSLHNNNSFFNFNDAYHYMVYYPEMLIKNGMSLLIEESNLTINSTMTNKLMDNIKIKRKTGNTIYTITIPHNYIQNDFFSEKQSLGFSLMVNDGDQDSNPGGITLLNIQDNIKSQQLSSLKINSEFSITAYIKNPLDTNKKTILEINNVILSYQDDKVYFNDIELDNIGDAGIFVSINYVINKGFEIITSVKGSLDGKLVDVKTKKLNLTLSSDIINIFIDQNVKYLHVANNIMELNNLTNTWDTNSFIPQAGQSGWSGYYPDALLYPATASKAGTIVLTDKKRKNMYLYFFLFVIILFFLKKRN